MTQKIDTIIQKILSKEQSWHIQLLSNWNSIMGPLHSKVQLEKIEHETLILGVFDSCWMQELYLLSPLLLKTINQNLDQPRIKQLRFKTIGTIKSKKIKVGSQKKEIKQVELSRQEKEALKMIADTELQKALKNFLIRCYQERE